MRKKKFLAGQTMFMVLIFVMVCGHRVVGAQAIPETDPNEESRRLSEQALKIRLEANRGSPEAIRHAAMKALEIYEKAYESEQRVAPNNSELKDKDKQAPSPDLLKKTRMTGAARSPRRSCN